MDIPKKVIELVDRFENNLESYKKGQFNETQVRREFVDPFFEELGWDVANKQGYSEAYKEVVHEDAIKIGFAHKAPDYSFRIGGVRKFFLEAKKPSTNIKYDKHPAYQLRRYAWSSKLPLSILTDFEEFAIYDCRVKPIKTDKASTSRVLYLNYTEYKDRWDEISGIFSRISILKGSFDKYAESKRKKRGTAEVDTAFLQEIEHWRESLAHNIALRNPKLTQRELNFAVQRTIDRIIFLRICEDRGIETYGRLMALQNGNQVYRRLFHLFHQADDRYNSGLFHFKPEKGMASEIDDLTPCLTIDDRVLKEILKKLYYPDSPYEFSVLPADILGQVYEQFLGKVISLTPGHRARIEYKPEVRKAGGVYYTPTYIVNYIVEHTVGKILDGKKPGPRGSASKLKILDPACGSGSFLLGAYQYLLNWYRDQYVNDNPQKWAKGRNPCIYQGPGGEWRLTTEERKRILLDNIYGVDIDPQAVEVTKLSLLLKVLELEENQQLSLIHKRVLPDLGNNIKCGNSLIGPDFYNGMQLDLLDQAELYRINAFDWEAEFPEIMKSGGFDAVIGNPPWGSLITKKEKEYLDQHYVSRRGEAASHLYFIEKGFGLIAKKKGVLGFITPNTWLSVLYSQEIREYLLEKAILFEICELSKYIFRDAPDIVPALVFLSKDRASEGCIVRRTNTIKVDACNFFEVMNTSIIKQEVWKNTFGSTINLALTDAVRNILKKCQEISISLSDVANVLYGIKTGNNSKYLSFAKTATHCVKALKTGEISRYRIQWKGLFLWWCAELAGFRNSKVAIPKIVIQYIRKLSLHRRIIAALDTKGEYYPLNNYSYCTINEGNYSLLYLLGLINSNLLNFYHANAFIDYNIKPTYLQKLPIHSIDFSNPTDKAQHDRMVALVERMLDLHKQLASAKHPQDKTVLQRQIETTDHQIDRLVYELYGLTDEEIAIVEKA